MMRPTRKQLQGLSEIIGLVQADVDSDRARWPSMAPIHSGLSFLRNFVVVAQAVQGRSKL